MKEDNINPNTNNTNTNSNNSNNNTSGLIYSAGVNQQNLNNNYIQQLNKLRNKANNSNNIKTYNNKSKSRLGNLDKNTTESELKEALRKQNLSMSPIKKQ